MTIEQIEPLNGKGTMINSVYYILVPDQEKQRIQNELKSQLDINLFSITAQANQ
jgi:hypothetical protein